MNNLVTFGGIEEQYAGFSQSRILLQSIPWDGTSTWGKGADRGFEAFLHAAENMELYDIETDSEVYRHGIHLLPPLTENRSPEAVFEACYQTASRMLETGKFPTFFGGEHSISIGIIKAFYESFSDLTVVQLDAHTDLRPEYLGTPYNHACALYDASLHTNLIQVGIRSMDSVELPFLNREQCYFMQDIDEREDWMERALSQMTARVYVTFDLDGLDPSLIPGTGTPEPGGLPWYPTLKFLKKIFTEREVVGFDLVELLPLEHDRRSEFLAAKLYYKMLSYKFFGHAK